MAYAPPPGSNRHYNPVIQDLVERLEALKPGEFIDVIGYSFDKTVADAPMARYATQQLKKKLGGQHFAIRKIDHDTTRVWREDPPLV